MTPVFLVVCVLGMVTAVALAVREARAQSPVLARVVTTARHGLTTDATVAVANRTSVERCVVVRVVARDRAGHDLAATRIGPHRVRPHAEIRASAALVLTPRQYAEQLTLVRAVAATCP
jgi:hypothetical protein